MGAPVTWRQRSAEVIARVRAEHPRATGAELRKLLRDAYPFGPRQHHPYKAWLAEVRLACGPASAPAVACGACAGRGWVVVSAAQGSTWCRACGGKGKARAVAADERQVSLEVKS